MDIITTVAMAYVTKDGIEKLLGPTIEYYGIGLKNTGAERLYFFALI